MNLETRALALFCALLLSGCPATPSADTDAEGLDAPAAEVVNTDDSEVTPPTGDAATPTGDVTTPTGDVAAPTDDGTTTTPDGSATEDVPVVPTSCAVDADCDDGDACTGLETCTVQGTCAAGTPPVCDDGDPCTFDGCMTSAGGCVAVPDPTVCNDDDPCTIDTCLASGCLNEAVVCHDDDPCTDDACDGETGECQYTPAANAPPACDAPLTYSLLQVTIRTATTSINAPTDDGFQVCLGTDLCLALDVADYDDHELGAINEFLWPVQNLEPSAITEVSLSPTGVASDAWRPACVSVVADGKLLYCNDELNIDWLGTDADDTPSWTDNDPTQQTCRSCYPTVLSHGPMLGHTTANSARMWLRTAYSAQVSVRYGTTESLETATLIGPVTTTVDADYITIAELTDLAPDTRYFYEVTIDETVVRTGLSFKTAPSAPAAFNVAFGSCSKYAAYPSMEMFDEIAEVAPDLMLMIGDNHYANSNLPDTLRAYYLQHHGVESVAAVRAQTPTWATWDDHDFTGNNTDGMAAGKEYALAAFHRYWANPPLGSDGYPGVWHSFQWSDVEFFMVDDRYYRGVTPDSMLGLAQLDWLLWSLSTSTATFKVLVSGSQWTQGGTSDSWASFPDEWQTIVDHIMELSISGVITISGDVHRGEVRRITEASETTYALWEFTSSPLANSTSGCPDAELEPDDLLYCANIINYGLLRFDTTADDPTVTFELRSLEDLVLTSHTVTLSDLTL